ncbi:hypothetical protein H9M94_03325 [Mycoplasma sp. Pen4]|uniref:hypothetical protein n=1 Tax=Mycoplasma sp. Pen4 TaxID=640330 RepID=UPI0016542E3B|nr:hypothetical protein [Mycoplasma sp. Pen4]QNM93604.1 hypothetical protein H9M94_03325 [Mycoplasma sp. Pen4]
MYLTKTKIKEYLLKDATIFEIVKKSIFLVIAFALFVFQVYSVILFGIKVPSLDLTTTAKIVGVAMVGFFEVLVLFIFAAFIYYILMKLIFKIICYKSGGNLSDETYQKFLKLLSSKEIRKNFNTNNIDDGWKNQSIWPEDIANNVYRIKVNHVRWILSFANVLLILWAIGSVVTLIANIQRLDNADYIIKYGKPMVIFNIIYSSLSLIISIWVFLINRIKVKVLKLNEDEELKIDASRYIRKLRIYSLNTIK